MKRMHKGILIALLSSSALVLATQNTEHDQAQDDKYEFCLYYQQPWESTSVSEKRLDVYGSEGWTLVALARTDPEPGTQRSDYMFAFRRKLGNRGKSCDRIHSMLQNSH